MALRGKRGVGKTTSIGMFMDLLNSVNGGHAYEVEDYLKKEFMVDAYPKAISAIKGYTMLPVTFGQESKWADYEHSPNVSIVSRIIYSIQKSARFDPKLMSLQQKIYQHSVDHNPQMLLSFLDKQFGEGIKYIFAVDDFDSVPEDNQRVQILKYLCDLMDCRPETYALITSTSTQDLLTAVHAVNASISDLTLTPVLDLLDKNDIIRDGIKQDPAHLHQMMEFCNSPGLMIVIAKLLPILQRLIDSGQIKDYESWKKDQLKPK